MDHEMGSMGSRIEAVPTVYFWGNSEAYDVTCLCKWNSGPCQSLRTAANRFYNHVDQPNEKKLKGG